MGVLEKISRMRDEGHTDEDIASQLKEKGVSPKEINDAFNQAKIKSAVSEGQDFGDFEVPQQNQSPQSSQSPPTSPGSQDQDEGYYQESQNEYEEDPYTPQPIQEEQYSQYPSQSQGYDEYSPQQNQGDYYPQEQYSYGSANTDTIIEISEQVFSEKIERIRKKIEDFEEFRVLSETKLQNISERLKRIESIIDKLQISILDKIGSYGDNLSSIKKEMSMMQDSFRKITDSPKHRTSNSERHSASKKIQKKSLIKKSPKKHKK